MAVIVSSDPSQVSCHITSVNMYQCITCMHRALIGCEQLLYIVIGRLFIILMMQRKCMVCFYGSVKKLLRVVCLLKWSVLDDVIMTLLRHLLKVCPKQGIRTVAASLAVKINKLIAQERSRSLARLDSAGPKKLWDAVRKNSGSNNRCGHHPLLAAPNAVNDFFANISYDSSYKRLPCTQMIKSIDCDVSVEPHELERHLKRMKPTSAGPDSLP